MRIFYFDIDCLRPDHLGCYGYRRPTSPNIDRIAAEGVRFNHYYCADSPCLPSRMGLFSGRFGIHNGVVSNHTAGADFRIRTRFYGGPEPEEEMLIRQLRRHGYDAFSFSNFADRHNAMWFMNGWTQFHTINLKGGGETAAEVNDTFLPWLRQNARREDYFCHVNYWDAHRIYKMDVSWADRFRGHPVDLPWPDEETIARHQEIKGWFTATGQFRDHQSMVPLMPGAITNRAEFEQMVTGYDASIAYVDHHLGQVLEELERQGILEDAVIIISADHGDAFGEHGIYTDHVCADDCIHHVPLIVRWPGVSPGGSADDALLCNVDFSATLLDMVEAPRPAHYDGESFLGNIRGGEGFGRDYLVWGHALYAVQRCVRTRRHLLMRTFDDFGYRFDPVELYDMEADPYQAWNIVSHQSDIAARLDGLLNDWLQRELTRPWAGVDPHQLVLRERAPARLAALKKSD